MMHSNEPPAPSSKPEMEAPRTKTPGQIEALKREWDSDRSWDLWTARGFEAHREELRAYSEQKIAEERARERLARRRHLDETDQEAAELGLGGLYRMMLQLEELQNQHRAAIDALREGDTYRAYRLLNE